MAKEVEIIVKATDHASSTFDKIGNKSNSFADKIKANLWKIKIASWIATTALIWIGKTMLDSAKAIQPVQNSFDRLTKDIDQNSKEILASLQKASKWTISDYNLMLSANKAMSLWVAKNTDEFTTLMEIARVKGQAMWLTMEQAFSDIVTGLWRSSPMILDNLWITIKLWEAQETYAKILWKTVEEMTDQEKKQALINAVVSQWKQELESAGDVALTTAERQAQLQASLQNISATIWTALIPVFEKVMEIISPIVERFSNRVKENPKMASTILIVATSLAWLTFALSMLAPMISKIWLLISLLSWPIGIVLLAVWALTYWFYQLFTNFPTYEERMVALRWELTLLDEQFKNWTITQEQYNQKTEEVKAKMTELEEKSKTLWWTIRNDLAETVNSIKNTPETLSNFVNAMWAVFDWLAMKIGEVFLKIWEFFNNFWLSLQIIFENMWSMISGMIEWLFNRIQSIWDQINTMIVYALWVIKAWAEAIKTVWKWLWDWIKLITTSAYDWVVSKFNALTSFISSVVSKIKSAYNSVKNFISWWWSSGWKIAGARAEWWPVKAWKQYLVGERWPEMFVPNSSWNIIPNEKLWWQTGSQTININLGGVVINNEADETRLVEKIKTALTRESQLYLLGIN